MINWPSLILQNKYLQIYEAIIQRAQSRTLSPEVYVEKHHIIPQSMGGSNKSSNLAILTAREHFICHRLLTKFLTGKNKNKMSFAVWIMMTNNNPHQSRYKATSRVYELVKQEMVKVQRTEEYRKKISDGVRKSPNKKPPWNKGKTGIFSPEVIEKLRVANLGKKISQETIDKARNTAIKNGTVRLPGTWTHSESARIKLREARSRQVITEEHRRKISESSKGRKHSPETIAKLSAKLKSRKLSQYHVEKLKIGQASRRQREFEEKIRLEFTGPIKPNTAIEFRNVWYANVNQAGIAHGISRKAVIRQIKAFGNSPSLDICKAIDDKTIMWPISPRPPVSEETRLKISRAQIGKVVSDETRAKQSESARKKAPPSAETRKKLSDAGKGRIISPATIAKRAAKLKGRVVTEETRQKIRATLIETYKKKGFNVKDPNAVKTPYVRKGRKASDETRAKMRKPKSQEARENMKVAAAKREALKKERGYVVSDETRAKLREAAKHKIKSENIQCPHCSKIFNPGNYKMWHGENCKLNINKFETEK